MNRIIVGLALCLCASSAMSDIWKTLFNDKLQEAKNGNSEAQYDVGSMYQNGRGVAADREKAIEWYQKAAALGDAKAASRLKLIEANAARFEKTASQAAKGDRESQYDLGNMYMKGVGTNIDYAKAISSFEQSAKQGHVKAAYKLGLTYYEGTGVKASGKEAFRWFKQAAGKDYPAAQYYMGKLYAEGRGVKRDRPQALIWFGKAVDGGFDQARGEMIDVSETMKMAATQAAAAKTAAADAAQAAREKEAAASAAKVKSVAKKTKPAPKKTRTARKSKPVASKKSARKRFAVEDLILASWNRDTKPVSYLPSAINTCRIEDSRIICFSNDQTRNSGANVIKFKTKAIISNFSSKGTFDVTYRNLVVNTSQQTASNSEESIDEPGGIDDDQPQAYTVKTGWSNPHTLNCKMKNRGTVSCLKNKTHTFLLISPTTLAAGE